jgi:hypothetical protein
MKKLLTILLILVVIVCGCTSQTVDVESEEDALKANQDMGEGLGGLTNDLNQMIDGLE